MDSCLDIDIDIDMRGREDVREIHQISHLGDMICYLNIIIEHGDS